MAYVGKITDTSGTTGPVGSTLYGTCTTAADQAAKVVTCADFDKLITGVVIFVKFTNSNTNTGTITLNVNGTGAKNLYRYGTTKPGNYGGASWLAGSVVSCTYDGTNWIMNDWLGNDNNYDRTSMQMRIYAGTNGVFPYSIVALDTNGRMQAMTTTGGTGTDKVFNSNQKFRFPPYIMYHAENSTKTNGQVITNNVLYEQMPAVDLRYSSNITSSAGFTQYWPLYIECTIDDNGFWSPTGITQTFAAGKYYILLGVMYNTSIYQVTLSAQHPVFKCTTAGSLEMCQFYTKAEKDKLAGIEDQANKYVHPTYTAKTSGLYKITVDGTGHVSAATAATGSDLPSHSHTLSMATDSGTSSITLAASTKYKLTAGGSTYIFTTPPNTTYTPSDTVTDVATSSSAGTATTYSRGDHKHKISLATGDSNGQVKIAGTNVSVKGLGSAAYTASTEYAPASDHPHPLSIATDSGTSSISLAANTKYKLTAGGSTYVFTTPPDGNTDTKVNVTLATTTKAYLLGTSTTPTATAQAVTSVADTGVYLTTTAGHLQATVLHASAGVNANTANSNTAGGLSLYGTNPDNYGVIFRGTSQKGVHGYVQSDWATYFTMNNADTRGWIFHKQSNVASISGAGNAVFNGSVTVGGNTANTSGCRMVYSSTTQSLDFVFA